MAERLGVPRETVDYYERRAVNPTLDVIQKVADALEVSPGQLIGDNNGLVKISRKTGPTSMLLLGTGLVGIAGAVRKRFKSLPSSKLKPMER